MSFLCDWWVFNHSLVVLISLNANYPPLLAYRKDNQTPCWPQQWQVNWSKAEGEGWGLGLCKCEWETLWQMSYRGDKNAGDCKGLLPRRGQGLVLGMRFSSPLIHVLLAILAVAPWEKSTLLCTYGGKNLVHQLNAYCTTYTFCFISGPRRAANAYKLGNLLCSKNTDRRS